MKPGAVQVLQGLGLALIVIAWAILAHLGSTGEGSPDLNVLAGGAPIALAVLAFCGRWYRPWGMLFSLVVLTALAFLYWQSLRDSVPLLYLLQQVGVNLALASVFGRTLGNGCEPLVTSLARKIYGNAISTRKLRYTRQVTLAWTLFFLLNATTSLLLFFLATPYVWSVYANFLGPLLVAAMFVGEHLIRMRVLPPEERPSLVMVVRSWRERHTPS